MKNIMRKALLVSACVLAAPSLMAQAANKTVFVPRHEHQHGGRAWALTSPHYMNFHQGGRFGISMNANVYHSQSDNKAGLGEYFGAAANADLSDANGTAKVVIADGDATNALHGRDIDQTVDIATGVGGTDALPMGGTLSFAPTQKRTGVMLDFDWDISKMFKGMAGWTVGISAPIVEVKNSLGVTFPTDELSTTGSATGRVDKIDAGKPSQFFAGTYTQTSEEGNKQPVLTHARINTSERSASGVADVKATVGYAFVTEHDSRVRLRASFIVPTGNRSTGVDLFEALYGNGYHYGAALGGAGTLRLWNNAERKMSLWLSGDAEYTFLFQGKEKRVAGIYDVANKKTAGWLHYKLATENNKAGLFPIANKLVQDINVTPGSHFDATVGLTWAWKNLHANIGYNLFYKQSEDCRLATQWPLDRYGLSTYGHYSHTTTTKFEAASFTDNDFDGIPSTPDSSVKHAVGPIQTRGKSTSTLAGASVLYQVDTDVCSGADQETHSLHFGGGYKGTFKKVNFNVNVAGSYELAGDSSKALEGWHVAGGVGVCF